MKTAFKSLWIFCGVLAWAATASAASQVIATWSFDNDWTQGGTSATIPAVLSGGVLAADGGLDGAVIYRTASEPMGGGPGYVMEYNAPQAGTAIDQASFILQLEAAASLLNGGFSVNYAASAGVTGGVVPITEQWAYSINGGVWTVFGSGTIADTGDPLPRDGFSAGTPTLTLNAGDTLWLRDTISGGGTDAGDRSSVYFDNVNVAFAPIPEPSPLAIFGLVFVVATVGRFWLRRLRRG